MSRRLMLKLKILLLLTSDFRMRADWKKPWSQHLFLFHFLNILNDESIRSDIRDKQVNHIQLNKLHEEHRLWRDAVLFYQEPELDPAGHEKKVQEYCHQRMLKLHLIL